MLFFPFIYFNHIYPENGIRVVLMDMVMPIMDGLAAIRALYKIDPQVKVIAVSGLIGNDKLAEVTDTKVDYFC
ncbi:MAG: response regulator transcription factor [Ignavibacteriales bacterium]